MASRYEQTQPQQASMLNSFLLPSGQASSHGYDLSPHHQQRAQQQQQQANTYPNSFSFTHSPTQFHSEAADSPTSPPTTSTSSYSTDNLTSMAAGLASFGAAPRLSGPSNATFDPTDYTAQGLDESAFSSNIAFQMPSFLTNGAPPSELVGPAFLSGPAMMEDAMPKSRASRAPTQPLFLHPPLPQLNSTPSLAQPENVYGMYGSSYIGVSDDSRSFKKYKSDPLLDTASFVQRGYHQYSPDNGYSQMPAIEEPFDFDPTLLGLPAPHGGNYPGLYSESGFDLVGVLARVVARPNPIIDIGPIDSSTAFVVCDARRYDYPIVYASETFSRLTGYSSPELLGRNCRFLQSSTGRLDKGAVRKETDGKAVKHLISHIEGAKECQTSLVNYKKGGEPFINLVTIVPITWDSDEITYYVGFQVNLVNQPNAILDRMRNGTYVINHTLLPEHMGGAAQQLQAADPETMAKQNAEKQQSQVDQANLAMRRLSGTLGEGGDSTTQLVETLLDQCDDMIHVLSLKGSLLYISPAVERILNYAPNELLGKNLSRICHPSDWIAVQRELKESSSGDGGDVNLLYRIRRKNAGFVWIEAQGKLHVESKGHKYVILLARERPVHRLSWTDLQRDGGVGDVEFWSKLSLDGTYLDVTSSVTSVLSRDPASLIGSTIRTTHPPQHQPAILHLISSASRGQKGSLRHLMYSSSGEETDVVTHFWPMMPNAKLDGQLGKRMEEGSFVLCQTNLVDSEARRRESVREMEGKVEQERRKKDQAKRPILGRQRSASMSQLPTMSSTSMAGRGTAGGAGGSGAAGQTAQSVQSVYKLLNGHPALRRDNVFNEVDSAHSTSWLYEIHLLENLNKRLREERDALVAVRSSPAIQQAGLILSTAPTPASLHNKKRKRTFSELRPSTELIQ